MTRRANKERLADVIYEAACPLTGAASDYDPLMGLIGEARFVLLGEATHGTEEFYHERAQITKRLIVEKGFTIVAAEADWPAAYRVNRFVQGASQDQNGSEALADFTRFPAWMWRNIEVLEFVNWLRTYNDTRPETRPKIGFYGLDLYSLYASIAAVLAYLDKVDPEAAQRARHRYGCFDHYGEDAEAYGYAAGFRFSKSCEDEVIRQLVELRLNAEAYLRRDGLVAQDEFFYAEQNARLVKNAEEYYRTLFQGGISSWNLRDRHMVETLNALNTHFTRQGRPPKIVVWEHNSHIGDARATQMAEAGELNVGQLVREQYGSEAVLIGFTTNSGSVTAASHWDGPAERKAVRPALSESYEALFHQVGTPRFLLPCREVREAIQALNNPRLERAIGVVYLPETERISHYFYARLPQQFDAVIHIDQTTAVEPLDPVSGWERKEAPETHPYGV